MAASVSIPAAGNGLASGASFESNAPVPSLAEAAFARSSDAALRVLLVTPNAVFATRLAGALLDSNHLRLVTAESIDSNEVPQCRVLVIDAALLQKGVLSTHAMRRIASHGGEVMLAFEHVEESAVQLSLRVRAHGCIEFNIAATQFERAVDAVAKGEFWFPRRMMAPLYDLALSRAGVMPPGIGSAPSGDLTVREIEVMRLVRSGLTNKQIAQELAISPNTVKKHLHNALAKRGIQRRRQLYK